MSRERRAPALLTVQQMDEELIAMGLNTSMEELFTFPDTEGTTARTEIMELVKALYENASPLGINDQMVSVDIYDLARRLISKTGQLEENRERGIWGEDGRMDYFGITLKKVRDNADCVAAVTLDYNISAMKNGFSQLRVKNYAKVFNLWDNEPFREQPVSVGPLCSGFLVSNDLFVTAAHFIKRYPIEALRIVFGFKLMSPQGARIKIPDENIYRVKEKIQVVHNQRYNGGDGCDFSVLRLDRDVTGQRVVRFSMNPVQDTQRVYTIGHPVGLPLKYGPGAKVLGVDRSYFSADLDIYMGNSGSPVFDADSHELVGMVVRGDPTDFRWTGKGWGSVIYPNRNREVSVPPECTLASQFEAFCR